MTAWCAAPGVIAVRTRESRPPQFSVHELEPADHATIVNEYFKRYAPEAEWRHEGWECTATALSGPHPDDRAKIVELLEDAARKR